jgi:hypothetical protein
VIKSRRVRLAGQVARVGREVACTWFWWENREKKRPVGRPRSRWEDTIKTDLQEVGCVGMNRIKLALDRDRWRALVNAVMNIHVQ